VPDEPSLFQVEGTLDISCDAPRSGMSKRISVAHDKAFWEHPDVAALGKATCCYVFASVLGTLRLQRVGRRAHPTRRHRAAGARRPHRHPRTDAEHRDDSPPRGRGVGVGRARENRVAQDLRGRSPLLCPQSVVEMTRVAVIQDVAAVRDGWSGWWGSMHRLARSASTGQDDLHGPRAARPDAGGDRPPIRLAPDPRKRRVYREAFPRVSRSIPSPERAP
jgi:hypothetical protein